LLNPPPEVRAAEFNRARPSGRGILACFGKNPMNEDTTKLLWKKDAHIHLSQRNVRFDLNKKAAVSLELLRYPGTYGILLYTFSRGFPYQCNI
ncbi:MAG: hypothetical protein JSW15_10875, partial [Deltaproteobacteria bacterium]